MKLLTLVVVMMGFSSLAVTEVVKSFDLCPHFFMGGKVPTAPKWGQQKKICQRWKNKYMFATLFDIRLRIPVYSAYTFIRRFEADRDDEWKNEPQLETISKHNKQMKWITDKKILDTFTHQGEERDFRETLYTLGHVFPNQYGGNQDQSESTFTLTNVAPQRGTDNGNWATYVETPMLNDILRDCRLDQNNPAYIVTGVVPGTKWIEIKRGSKTFKEGINVPTHYWTSYCCKDQNKRPVSGGYISEQNNNPNTRPEVLTITQLNLRLQDLYNTKPFTVFKDDCSKA